MKIVASGLVSSQGFEAHNHKTDGEDEFHYFLAGKGCFCNSGKEFEQVPGSLFYSRSQENHWSRSLGEVPTAFFFVRFQSSESDSEWTEVLQKLFSDSAQTNVGKGFQLAFEEIRQRSNSQDPLFRRAAEHRLISLLYDLAGGRTSLPSAGQSYVNSALEMMQTSIHGTLDLTSLAGKLGIDPSYFSRIFHQAVGMSPMKYFTGLKVESARFLLVQTRLSMAQIAAELAFRDEFHFSHTIRRTTGFSPTQIRQGSPEIVPASG